MVQQDYQPPDGHHPDQAEDAVLFEKLEHYGIRGIVLSWFKSYSSGRKQKVGKY